MRFWVIVAVLALAGAAVAQDDRTQAFAAYQEQNWDEARRLFAAARVAHPEDTELALHERASTQNAAGAAYNAGRYADTIALLDEAERIEAPAHIVEHARTLRAQALAELAKRGGVAAPRTAPEEGVAPASAPSGTRDVGWYETEAQSRLDGGDAAGAVEIAHEGLALYPDALGLNRIVGRHDPKAAGDHRRHKSVTAGNFAVKFRGVEPDPAIEAQMLEGLAEAETQLGRDFGFRMDRPVNVIVFASGQDYVAQPGAAVWSEAAYNGSLQLPLEIARMQRAYFVSVVTHELAHHMIHMQAHSRAPSWFHEGVAQLAAGPAGDDHALKAALAGQGSGLLKLAQLRNGICPDGDASRTGATYAQVYSILKALTDRFGFGIVNNLLADMQGGANFDTAFQSRTGTTVAQFERDWLAAQQ